MESILKAGASTVIGAALAATVGIGWWKGTGGAILLKNCPIELTTIGEHDKWARIQCFFPVREEKYGDGEISGKMKGWFSSRRAVDLKLEGHDVPGFEDIERDQRLLKEILSLFQTRLVPAFREFYPKIFIRFEKPKNIQYGIVEYGMQRYFRVVEHWENKLDVSYLQITKRMFSVANAIVSHISRACKS